MATKVVDLGNVMGPQGPKGDTGAAGPQGPKGETGATGPQGPMGYTGAQGPKGDIGATGPQGPKGADGVGIGKAGTGTNAEVFNGTSAASASGGYSHVEGNGCTATKICSHAEGDCCTAAGNYAHAEGSCTAANGNASHAEGSDTYAESFASHAEGEACSASGRAAHAEGFDTSAANYASHAGGHNNKNMTTGGSEDNQVGDAFVVGNGTSSASNAFRVTYAGTVYGKGSFQTSGADYAEYFEWLDANPEGQDRVGYFVTLEGKKIKLAGPGDYILGIVSGNPCVIGNADEDWLGRWLHDDFDRYLREYLEESEEAVEVPAELEGRELRAYLRENHIVERDGAYYQKTATVVDHETPSWRYKANPAYDPSQAYIERKDRPEWAAVGMMGVLAVRDDGTCQAGGFCQVAEGGIATPAEGYAPGLTYRVIERVNERVVKVIFR